MYLTHGSKAASPFAMQPEDPSGACAFAWLPLRAVDLHALRGLVARPWNGPGRWRGHVTPEEFEKGRRRVGKGGRAAAIGRHGRQRQCLLVLAAGPATEGRPRTAPQRAPGVIDPGHRWGPGGG